MQEQKQSGRIWRRWWLHTSIDTSNFWRFNPNEVNESIIHGLIFVNFWRDHPWQFLINVSILMGALQWYQCNLLGFSVYVWRLGQHFESICMADSLALVLDIQKLLWSVQQIYCTHSRLAFFFDWWQCNISVDCCNLVKCTSWTAKIMTCGWVQTVSWVITILGLIRW